VERNLVRLADGRVLDVVEVGDRGAPVAAFCHGTPGGPLEVVLAESAAREAGVRLVAIGRPGYAGSTPVDDGGLARFAVDQIEVLDRMGITTTKVLGVSGGAPFAAALALAGPERVDRLGILAGVGPRDVREEDDPDDTTVRRVIDLVTAGDRAAAVTVLTEEITPFIEMVRTSSPPAMPPGIAASIVDGARNGFAGYVHDALCQVLPWDIDVSRIRAATWLVYGDADTNVPPAHGEWYAGQVPGAVLTVLPGADHPGTIGPSYPAMLSFLAGGPPAIS